MSKLSCSNSQARLYSTAGTFGEIAVVAMRDSVLIDATTRNYDTAGHLHREHALANLPLSAAIRLRDMLSEAVDHAYSVALDARQAVFTLGDDEIDRCATSFGARG